VRHPCHGPPNAVRDGGNGGRYLTPPTWNANSVETESVDFGPIQPCGPTVPPPTADNWPLALRLSASSTTIGPRLLYLAALPTLTNGRDREPPCDESLASDAIDNRYTPCLAAGSHLSPVWATTGEPVHALPRFRRVSCETETDERVASIDTRWLPAKLKTQSTLRTWSCDPVRWDDSERTAADRRLLQVGVQHKPTGSRRTPRGSPRLDCDRFGRRPLPPDESESQATHSSATLRRHSTGSNGELAVNRQTHSAGVQLNR